MDEYRLKKRRAWYRNKRAKFVFSIATDARKVFLGLGPVVFPTRPEVAANYLVPSAELSSQDDYVFCIVGGRPEFFAADEATLCRESSAELQKRSVEMLSAWPKQASAIPAHANRHRSSL